MAIRRSVQTEESPRANELSSHWDHGSAGHLRLGTGTGIESGERLYVDRVHQQARDLLAVYAQEHRLSRRESQTVELSLLQGHSIKEVAHELGLSRKTIEMYWTRIYAKTGCRSQQQVFLALFWVALSDCG